MFIPRRFVAALLIGAALCTLSGFSRAVDADASPTPKAHAAKKASPSPSPAKKAEKSPTPAAKKPAAPKPDPAASPKKNNSDAPRKSESSDDQPVKKKSKAKPKPATQKRQRSKQKATEPKSTESTSKRRTEPETKPEPQQGAKPEKSAEKSDKQEPEKKPQQEKSQQEPRQFTPDVVPAAAGAKPTTTHVIPLTKQDNSVVISKSGVQDDEPPEPPEPEPATHWWWPFGGHSVHYQYLTRSVRNAIDEASVARHRWRYIVVHNSGTRQGSAKAFDYYHKHVRKMPNGLAYHFVIGNGTSTPDGHIEIGPRWVKQLDGGHVHSDYLNSISLGICLVGDYNKDRPTKEQLAALDELIRYLRKRVGKTDRHLAIVKPHRDINPPQWPTDCPGDRFPYQWLNNKFEDQ